MLGLFLVGCFLFGALIGSFFNVLIPRGNIKKSITGHSKCPKCKKNIPPLDLIPIVSYLVLRGKCRNCKKRISEKYPIIEVFSGVFFVLEGIFLLSFTQLWVLALPQVAIFLLLLYLAIFDTWYKEIPLYPSLVAFFLSVLYKIGNIIDLMNFSYYWLIAVILPIVAIFIITRLYKRQVFGLGDYLILLVLAFSLSAQEIFVALEVTIITGAFAGIFVSIVNKTKLNKTIIPLVPFFVIGWFVALNWGEKIWDILFSL